MGDGADGGNGDIRRCQLLIGRIALIKANQRAFFGLQIKLVVIIFGEYCVTALNDFECGVVFFRMLL